jgi:bile acid:Na+ symporter, BASS family
MSFIIDFAIPVLTFFIMLIVGMDLTIEDFRRIVIYPRLVITSSLYQWIFLPLLAWGLILLIKPTHYIAVGIILIASAPGGALSNYYAYLASVNTALSVTLTAISNVFAIITMPLLISLGFHFIMQSDVQVDLPILKMVIQILLMLLLPIGLGMLLRKLIPEYVIQNSKKLRILSIVALALLLLFIFYKQPTIRLEDEIQVIILTLSYTIIAILFSYLLGNLSHYQKEDNYTFVIEFTTRNLAIVTLIGATVLKRIDFVIFAAHFFIIQAITLLIIGKLLYIIKTRLKG